MKPLKNNFAVNKIQRIKDGLSIDFTTIHQIGEQFIEEHDVKASERYPDEKFIEDLNSLKQYVSKIINYSKIKNVMADKKFAANDEQSKYLTRLITENMGRISINGIQLWSDGEAVTACRINFSLEGFSGQKMECKTYKIDVSESNIHDFEEELKELSEALIVHAYEYIFENKGGQGELAPESE